MTQFPIYTSRGDWVALLEGRYLFSARGDWIGWIDGDSQIFSARGEYAGWLSRDFRILARRETNSRVPRRAPPPAPPPPKMPTNVPLPPLMAELTYDTVDLFEDKPHLLDVFNMDQVQDID